VETQYVETKKIGMADKFDIKKISIKEVKSFITSDLFAELDIKPISPNRAQSYINNPHCAPDDNVIYMLFIEKNLVCFRTVLPDLIKINGQNQNFAWLSGNYTKPEQRRKGFSKLLLEEITKDYHGKLAYTNYAPESHQLYSDTGDFKCITTRNGSRFYGKININNYVSKGKTLLKILAPIINILIGFATWIKRLLYKTDKSIQIQSHTNEMPESFPELFQNNKQLLNRSTKEFEWIFKYPWLTTKKEFESYNYPFSFYTEHYNYHFLQVTKKNENTSLILLERDGNIKLSYANYTDKYLAAKTILDLCYKTKAKSLTILNNELSQTIISQQIPFIKRKPFNMGIYTSFPIENPDQYSFQDGDGDNIFS
jgi:hypothetical protein